MIVITLTKVPKALRGDLTKWYQEIQTGVYVGNVSARVRDSLWSRIVKNIGQGQATMVYNANNEIGYQFKTTRRDHQVVDFDGIPLMMRLAADQPIGKYGYSNAAKFHKARVMKRKSQSKSTACSDEPIVAVDIETTGLNPTKDVIISVAAVKGTDNGQVTEFGRLIKIDRPLPENIIALTGITDEMLKSQGVPIDTALSELKGFIGNDMIVGYNFHFDDVFLKQAFEKINMERLTSRITDLMPIVKRTNLFLESYRLSAVLEAYQIVNPRPHNALKDASSTLKLARRLIKDGHLKV
ncbi:type I-E CRISPR-associated endoribonuclease Cas2e [Lactiplantibacillus pentosus]|jgi:CRISPR-associated protein Cas2|uniref:type I-E CRISPR-associated endoribonuclease Cas2e n=1 Tax=Lactiplantibacillus pentosus TaxID=1589 RepID=UPI00207A865C|nr:type I-E CRISPR-associated endoribonuclease Cas2e [Lactiplantibacillus pentosus]USJ87570.1 type I-E CRISPR-associated endoribonuclease Cas2e [Lactiplantibacillus pentosus]